MRPATAKMMNMRSPGEMSALLSQTSPMIQKIHVVAKNVPRKLRIFAPGLWSGFSSDPPASVSSVGGCREPRLPGPVHLS